MEIACGRGLATLPNVKQAKNRSSSIIKNIMWILWALGAALLWGFDYAFAERVLKHISMSAFLALQLLCAGIIAAIISWIQGDWPKDLETLTASRGILALFLMGVAAFTIANIFILHAINEKDATLSGLVEISYPLFIALVSWIVFRENQLTLSAALGGLLIFSGIFVIYFFNR